MGLQKQDTICR